MTESWHESILTSQRDEPKFIRWNLAGFNTRFSDQKQENKQAFNRITT